VSKKLEQKQQRRQAEAQRKRELQRAARRRNLITIAIIILVAAIVVGAIYYQRRSESGPVGVASAAAGCGEIERPPELPASHVPDGEIVDYNSDPPTSGPHYETPAEPSFYPPGALDQIPRERFVHNLEHGQIVFWYRPDAPEKVIDDIEKYINKQSGRQSVTLLADPYEGVDPAYSFTMTAWGASESCQELSEEVVGQFREEFQGRGPENPGVQMATFDFERDG
jgi:uncharacterized protein DUF3105